MTTINNTRNKINATSSFLLRKSVAKDSSEKFKWLTTKSNEHLNAIEPLELSEKALKKWYDLTGQGFDFANIDIYKTTFHFGRGKGKYGKGYTKKDSLYLCFDKSVRIYNRLKKPILLCPEGNTDALSLVSIGADKHYGILKRDNLQTVPSIDDIPDHIEEIIFLRDKDETKEELTKKLEKKEYRKLVERGIKISTVGVEAIKKKDISEALFSAYDENFDKDIEILNYILNQKEFILYSNTTDNLIPIEVLFENENMRLGNKVTSYLIQNLIYLFFIWEYNIINLNIRIKLNKAEWDKYYIPNMEQWSRTFPTEWTTFDNNYANGIDRFVKQMAELKKGSAVTLNDKSLRIITSLDSENTIDPFSDYFDKLIPIEPNSVYNPVRDVFQYLKLHDDIIEHLEMIVLLVGKWLGMALKCAKGEQINEIMIILTGDQGAGKTTFFNRLIPEALKDYVADTVEENKDGTNTLTDSILAIDDELDGMKRGNIEKLKKRLSSTKFKFRPPYGSKNVMKTRRASFLGATNSDNFLVDSTGNRRFLSISVVKNPNSEMHTKNMKKLREIDTDKLWAVGKYYAEQEEKLFFTSEEIEFIEKYLNKPFEEDNIYDQLVKCHIKNPDIVKDNDGEFMTPFKIMNKIDQLNRTNFSNDKYSSINIGKALKKAGFVRTSKYSKLLGYTEYGYKVVFI